MERAIDPLKRKGPPTVRQQAKQRKTYAQTAASVANAKGPIKKHGPELVDAQQRFRRECNLIREFSVEPRLHTGRSGPVPADFDPWHDSETSARAAGLGAIRRWVVARIIDQNRAAIEGNGMEVFRAIAVVTAHGLVAPNWLADEFLLRCARIERHEVFTTDEAFGRTRHTQRSLKALRTNGSLIAKVARLLWNEILENPRRPLTIDLFEEVGEKLGIGKTLCRDLYNEGVRVRGYMDLKRLKKALQAQK